MNIDLEIKIKQAEINNKKEIFLFGEEFCDLLNTEKLSNVCLNSIVLSSHYTYFYHELKYDNMNIKSITEVGIYDSDDCFLGFS